MPASASAQEMRYDFSDINEPFIEFPFKVTDVEVTGDWTKLRHNYYIAEPYEKVKKKLETLMSKNQPIGRYYLMSVTPQLDRQMVQIILAYRNEHFYAQVMPNGAGTLIAFEACPVSYVVGSYDASIYGFVLPNGREVSIDLQTDE